MTVFKPAASWSPTRPYDAGAVLKGAAEAGCRAVIPSKSSRRRQRPLDEAVYATRDVVERFFGRIKFWRAATRFDKRARNFAAAAILTVVRHLLRNAAKLMIESATLGK